MFLVYCAAGQAKLPSQHSLKWFLWYCITRRRPPHPPDFCCVTIVLIPAECYLVSASLFCVQCQSAFCCVAIVLVPAVFTCSVPVYSVYSTSRVYSFVVIVLILTEFTWSVPVYSVYCASQSTPVYSYSIVLILTEFSWSVPVYSVYCASQSTPVLLQYNSDPDRVHLVSASLFCVLCQSVYSCVATV